MSTITRPIGHRDVVAIGVPVTLLGITSGVLSYLNRSAAWGWVVAGVLLAGTVLVVVCLRGRAVRVTPWSVASVLPAVAVFGSHPGLQHRSAAGEGATPGGIVRRTHGRVSGLRTADRAVEVFGGVPYARPPVGDLRRRPPCRRSRGRGRGAAPPAVRRRVPERGHGAGGAQRHPPAAGRGGRLPAPPPRTDRMTHGPGLTLP